MNRVNKLAGQQKPGVSPSSPLIPLELSAVRIEDIFAEDVLHPIFSRVMKTIHASSGLICWHSISERRCVIKCSLGFRKNKLKEYADSPDLYNRSLAGRSLKHTKPLMVFGKDLCKYLESRLLPGETTANALALPIRIRTRAIGSIVVLRPGRKRFTRAELELMQIVSGQLAGALEYARLFEILHRGKTEWEKTFDAMRDPVAILDMQARLIRVNLAFASCLGMRPQQLIGKSYYHCFYDVKRPPDLCPVQLTLNDGKPHSEELGNRRLRGTYRVSTSPLESPAGECVGTVVLAQDISVRKRLESEVRRQRDYLSNILRNSPNAIVTTDLEGRIQEFNRSAEEMTKFSCAEVRGRSWLELFPEKEQRLLLSNRVSKRESIVNFAAQVLTKQANRLEISLTLSYLRGEEGSPVGTVSIWKDITEWNYLHRQLLQAEKLSAIGELVSGVAHELNNPLTSILGFTELLMETPLDPNVYSDLQKIHAQGSRMLKIVQNLLRFARKYQPEKSPVDLNLVVRSTLELKAYEMKVDNIRIVEDLTEDLPFIVGDANQLQQVFLNILNNAHQAMMEIRHQRLLRVSTRQKDGLVRVSIEDSGPGIPKSIMSRIFDPFFTTKPLGQGTGLGLSVSFGIIKEHRGSIRAESEPGRGATFIMDLPVPEE